MVAQEYTNCSFIAWGFCAYRRKSLHPRTTPPSPLAPLLVLPNNKCVRSFLFLAPLTKSGASRFVLASSRNNGLSAFTRVPILSRTVLATCAKITTQPPMQPLPRPDRTSSSAHSRASKLSQRWPRLVCRLATARPTASAGSDQGPARSASTSPTKTAFSNTSLTRRQCNLRLLYSLGCALALLRKLRSSLCRLWQRACCAN